MTTPITPVNPVTSETAQSVPVKTDFPIWKTISLGTHSRHGLVQELKQQELLSSIYTPTMLEGPEFKVAPVPTSIDLVRVTAVDLGHKGERITITATLELAMSQGLMICPTEVGAQLALQHTNEPDGTSLYVASEKLSCEKYGETLYEMMISDPRTGQLKRPSAVFYLMYKNKKGRLQGTKVTPEHLIPTINWIFIKPRK